MSKIITFKGKLNMGTQERLHLSTNDGLMGYRINRFQIISSQPGATDYEYVAKIYTTDQTGSISATVDMSDTDLIGVVYYKGKLSANEPATTDTIIFDKETINQDIYITIQDAAGGTVQANFYIELEKFTLNLNEATYHTIKNIRSSTQA